MGDEEKDWIDRVYQGDDAAYTRLVEKYQQPVFNLCYRMLGTPMEAEDAAQETFIRAYTRFSTYDASRRFSSWLFSLASHYCIDQIRRRRFQVVSWDELPYEILLSDPSRQPEEIALDRENEKHVRALLNSLPPDYKAAVILRYWHGLPYEEIANMLGSTLSAVKSRLFRARKMMADMSAQTQPAYGDSPAVVAICKG